MEEVLQARPHLNGSPLDVLPDPEGEAPVVVDEIAEVFDEGEEAPRVQQVYVNFNQKDDYLHRGSSVLLQCVSLLCILASFAEFPGKKLAKWTE